MDVRDPGRTRRALIIAVIVAMVLQVALAPQISILGGRINFMLALAGACALTGDSSMTVWVAFICGLFYDLTAAVPVGLMTLILTVSSFVLAGTTGASAGGLSSRSIQLFFIYALIVCFINGIALFVLGIEGSILSALFGHGLASAALSTVAAMGFMIVQGRSDTGSRSFTARGTKHGSRYKMGR